jgi:hypothetical protein
LKSQEEILVNSKPRSFSDFLFEIYSKSEEVPIDKVVHLFKHSQPYFILFYFFQAQKDPFWIVQSLNRFIIEFKLKHSWFKSVGYIKERENRITSLHPRRDSDNADFH